MPLFKQLTEQYEPITPPMPRPCSTSPVLISVLQVWHVASLLCACEHKDRKKIQTTQLLKCITVIETVSIIRSRPHSLTHLLVLSKNFMLLSDKNNSDI